MHPPGYRLLATLGHGTTGVVFKAQCLKVHRVVALHFALPCEDAERPARDARFRRAVQALAQFSHPAIVQVSTVGEHDELPYYARTFVDGDTLEARAAARAIDLCTGFRIMHQLTEAVRHVHRSGFVHRNLRPSNVLIGPRGDARLIGFGRAKARSDDAIREDALALRRMLRWLSDELAHPLPTHLGALAADGTETMPSALASALARHI
jgi:serine/threonine-protein kinase